MSNNDQVFVYRLDSGAYILIGSGELAAHRVVLPPPEPLPGEDATALASRHRMIADDIDRVAAAIREAK